MAKNVKIYKGMTKGAIAATLAASLVAPSLAQAAEGDYYNAAGELQGDLKSIILDDAKFKAYVLGLDQYKVELGNKFYNAEEVNNLYNKGATEKDIAQKVIEAGLKGEEATLAVTSVTAINAKALKVTFGAAVKDTTKATFEVKKGTVKVNTSEITWNDAKTEATIALAGKLTAGEYTVNVTGLSEQALTGKVTAEDEKISSIEILSDVAVRDASTPTTKATVTAQVKNQYGEDVTKLYFGDITVTAGGVATAGTIAANGVVTLTLTGTPKDDDSINLVLVHAATGTSATKTVKLSAAASASEVSFGTLYNKDGKTLSQDTDTAKDDFYLPITVKDQYGKEITKATEAGDVMITNANPAVLTLSKLQEVEINGKKGLALKVTGVGLAGTSNVVAISKTSGKSTQATVTVAEGVKISSLALSAPAEVASVNAKVYFH